MSTLPIGALLGLLASGPAHASFIEITDRAAWELLVNETTIDFSTNDDGSPITNPAADIALDCFVRSGVAFGTDELLNPPRSYYNLLIYGYPGFPFGVDLPDDGTALGFDYVAFTDVGDIPPRAGTFTFELTTPTGT